jgi:hypothetical protein
MRSRSDVTSCSGSVPPPHPCFGGTGGDGRQGAGNGLGVYGPETPQLAAGCGSKCHIDPNRTNVAVQAGRSPPAPGEDHRRVLDFANSNAVAAAIVDGASDQVMSLGGGPPLIVKPSR